MRSRYSVLCRAVAIALLFFTLSSAWADTTYLAPDEFLRQVFTDPPPPSLLWLDDATQARLVAVLGHRYPQARLRYWRAQKKTVWILDEVGKDYPITSGFVVADDHIERAQVLIFRESRGEEIHLPAFLRQFVGAALDDTHLSKKIDGITGATLSVDAMQRMARTALILDKLAQ